MAKYGKFPTLKDSIVHRLRSDVITCRLRPGSVIRDNELSEAMGVSTSPIREALSQLYAERLVNITPNKRKIISPLDRKTALDFMSVYRILDFRAFELGLPRMDARRIQNMADCYQELERTYQAQDNLEFDHQARLFIDQIYKASENEELRRTLVTTAHWMARLTYIFSEDGNEYRLSGYREIMNSVMADDLFGALSAHRRTSDTFASKVENIESYPLARPE